MKASELRIGNYLQFLSGDVFQVKYNDFGILLDTPKHLHPRPIQLTPEWLERFGFNSKYKSVHIHWNLGPFCLEQKSNVDDDNNFIPQENIWYFGYSGWVVDIVHVHQLQNLYFALTGNELQED